MDNAQAVLIMTTFEQRKTARLALEQLFDDKLIVCAQLVDAETIFERDGKLGMEPEVVALLRTTAAKAPAAAELLERIHPSDTPEVLTLDAEPSAAYLTWMLAATGEVDPEVAAVLSGGEAAQAEAPTGAKEPVRRDRKGHPYRSAKYERKADRKASDKSKKKTRDAERKAKKDGKK